MYSQRSLYGNEGSLFFLMVMMNHNFGPAKTDSWTTL